jgi:hypothetical protein
MSKRWECEAVIIVGSRGAKTKLKRIWGSSGTNSITLGGQSYEMLQVDGIGLCCCGVSSSAQAKTRIAKLSKIGKHFDYQKVIVIDPPYTIAQARRAKVGVEHSWYFIKDKQALIDLLKIKYEDLDEADRKRVDSLIAPPPPPPQAQAPPPDREIVIAEDGSSMRVMRQPANALDVAMLSIMFGGSQGAFGTGSGSVRRKASEPAREAQPDVKKAKAISKDDMECLCCADNQKDTILNCGHLEMCGVCANKVQSCPSCSVAITERKHVWL